MISVCIATYNGEFYIKEQIHSILKQLGENDEIIISDDNSSDNTLKILKSFDDKRIRIYINNNFNVNDKNHVKISANFENALLKSSGDFIFLSDQDDVWCDNKVTEMLSLLEMYDLVISNGYISNGIKDECKKMIFEKSPIKNLCHDFFRLDYYGCCMAFKRNVMINSLPFPKSLPLHDGWIGLIAKYTGNSFFYNKPLIYYRLHSSNFSNNGNSLIYKVMYRVFVFFNLFIRILKFKIYGFK